jgi:hypothetical protein
VDLFIYSVLIFGKVFSLFSKESRFLESNIFFEGVEAILGMVDLPDARVNAGLDEVLVAGNLLEATLGGLENLPELDLTILLLKFKL